MLGIHRLMSQGLTPTNLLGNAVATIAMAKWEGALDEKRLHRVWIRASTRRLEVARPRHLVSIALQRYFRNHLERSSCDDLRRFLDLIFRGSARQPNGLSSDVSKRYVSTWCQASPCRHDSRGFI